MSALRRGFPAQENFGALQTEPKENQQHCAAAVSGTSIFASSFSLRGCCMCTTSSPDPLNPISPMGHFVWPLHSTALVFNAFHVFNVRQVVSAVSVGLT